VAALRIDPSYAEARANLGVALFRMGRDVEAIVQLREAVRLAPLVGGYHSNLALAYGRRGLYQEAAEEMAIGSRLSAQSP
jgi:Flp pilus assembly protein TadD